MTIAALVSGGLNIAGGLAGQEGSKGARAREEELTKEQLNVWKNLALPEFKDLNLQRFQQTGEMAPTTEAAEQLSMIDQLQNIQLDPRLRTAQMSALDTLQKLGQTGMTPEQRAELNAITRKTEAENQARLQQLLQQQDVRGVGSSDMGLAMRALEAQGAANRQAETSERTAATGFRQALEAITQAGGLAGQIEGTDYTRGSRLAEAQRLREMTNLGQRSDVQQRNVAARNAAQLFNLQQAQDIANRNVNLSGEEARYSAYERPKMQFDAGVTRATGISGGAAAGAKQAASEAAGTKKEMSLIGSGLGQMAGSYLQGGGSTGGTDTPDWNAFTKKWTTG